MALSSLRPEQEGPSPSDAVAYVRTAVLTMLALLGAVAGFCFLVDPYGVFDAPRLAHLTAVKSEVGSRLRLSKAFAVEHVAPATLITGSSVANVGLDPDSPAWSPAHRPVFNLGLDGTSAELQCRFLLHALGAVRPRHLILVASFEDSLTTPGDGEEGGPHLRVLGDGRPDPGYPIGRLTDIASALLSFRALADSALTLARQRTDLSAVQTRFGFEVWGLEEQYAHLQGSDAALRKVDSEMAAKLLLWRERPVWSVAPVRRMIAAALGVGADVVVVIPPAHADLVEVRRQIGVAADVSAWRTALAQAVAEAGAQGRVTLWDFSALSPYTTKPLPDRGDVTNPDRWFWDPAHFSTALGALLVARIEGAGGPADLGQVLGPAEAAAAARADAASQEAWEARHPDSVARIGTFVEQAGRSLCAAEPRFCRPRDVVSQLDAVPLALR